jgi:PAS domain S-box-containing protein
MPDKPTCEQLAHRVRELEDALSNHKRTENVLREKIVFWESVLKTLSVGITYTKDRKILWANKAMEQLFGFKHEDDYIGMDTARIYADQEEYIRIGQMLYDPQNQKKVLDFDTAFVKKDGTVFDGFVRISPIDSEDARQGVIVSIVDITDRKEAGEALRKSEARYRTIYENTGTATLTIQADTSIAMVNREYEKMSGLPREQIEGKMSWTEFVVPEDLENMVRYHKERRRKGGSPPRQYEFRFIDKDGHIKHVLNTVSLIPGTTDSISSLIDISQRKKAEERLRESEEFYTRLVATMPDIVVRMDMEGNILFVSDAALKISGYSRHDLEGQNMLTFIAPEDQERAIENNIRMLDGKLGPQTYQLMMKDGEKRLFEVNGDLLCTDDGIPYGIVHVMRDITEQRKLERLLMQAHKMEAIGTLAGGMAHDFNNLLMGIQGRASLVNVELDHTHPHKEHLSAIEDYVRSATNLTKQLLGVARGGKYEITPTDINHLVASSANMFGRTRKEIRIHEKLKPDPIIVAVDRKQIEQVLLNLYINAWQAMPEGGSLYLETRLVILDETYCQPYQVEPGTYAKISVTDSGIGIEPSIRQQIFDPFFTTKDKTRGTGLGLASAYGIIKNHGGMITVYSEVGHGTTFNIYLPLSDQEAQQGKTEEAELIKGNERVLLIDDETMILDVGAAMLKKLNYRVISASSGEEAIELIRQADSPIDLIILDLIMPGMDGSEAFDRIRKLAPEVPVMIASGYAMDGKAAGIMDKGANGFIQKPFTILELSRKVRDVIDSATSAVV